MAFSNKGQGGLSEIKERLCLTPLKMYRFGFIFQALAPYTGDRVLVE